MTSNFIKPLQNKQLIDAAVSHALSKKAEHLVLINLGSCSGIADWFLICQGNNEVHNHAIAHGIIRGLKDAHTPPWHTEGIEDGRWILLDYTDVIVSIMLPEVRRYYQLETLWPDCQATVIKE